MNLSNEWKEMCMIKQKLDSTMEKINTMFYELPCQFRSSHCGEFGCTNPEHVDISTLSTPDCELESCPFIEDGVLELEKW